MKISGWLRLCASLLILATTFCILPCSVRAEDNPDLGKTLNLRQRSVDQWIRSYENRTFENKSLQDSLMMALDAARTFSNSLQAAKDANRNHDRKTLQKLQVALKNQMVRWNHFRSLLGLRESADSDREKIGYYTQKQPTLDETIKPDVTALITLLQISSKKWDIAADGLQSYLSPSGAGGIASDNQPDSSTSGSEKPTWQVLASLRESAEQARREAHVQEEKVRLAIYRQKLAEQGATESQLANLLRLDTEYSRLEAQRLSLANRHQDLVKKRRQLLENIKNQIEKSGGKITEDEPLPEVNDSF